MGYSFNPKKMTKKAFQGAKNAVKNPGRAIVDLGTLGNKKAIDRFTGGAASNLEGTLNLRPDKAIALAKSAFGAYQNPGAAIQQVGNNATEFFSPAPVQAVADQSYASSDIGYSSPKKSNSMLYVLGGGAILITLILVLKRK